MLKWARSWPASGLSRAEYAARAGVSKHTLDYYRSRRCAAAPARLVELEVTGPAAGPPPASALALVLGNGRRIEVGAGFRAEDLARLLDVAEGGR